MLIDQKFLVDLILPLGMALVAITLKMLYARGLEKEFPWFARYLWLVLGRAPFLFALRPFRTAYFYSYWIAEAVTVTLSLLVIYEIYRRVLTSSGFNLTRSTFALLTAVLLALATTGALFIEHADSPALLRAVFILTQTVRIVQVGLLAVLLLASFFFNFYWQSLPFGFALGYGLYATLELVSTTFRTSLGPSGDAIFTLTKIASYQFAVLIWIMFLWRHRSEHALKKMPVESVAPWLQQGLTPPRERAR
ncbi:MAG: hypothetical protein ABIP12_02545 [Terriglobales bacterium]